MTQTLTPVASWDSCIIPVGGEARTIASLETGFQSLLNRTQYLFEEICIDAKDGGSYSPSAKIVLSRAGDTLDIGDETDTAELTIKQNAKLLADAGSLVQLSGQVVLGGATQTLTKSMGTSGEGRLVPKLDTDATLTVNSNLTLQPNATTRVLVQNNDLSANRTWALGTTGVRHGDTIQVCNLDTDFHIAIGGLNLKFASGSAYEATFIYDQAEAAWSTLSKSDFDF